jgi:DNA-binding beta-propeller fold protein YncE
LVGAILVGQGSFMYAVDPSWEKLPDNLAHPDVTGVAVDSSNRVHVLHRGEDPVIVYESDGRFIRSWGGRIFAEPHGLRIGPDDSVYVTDDVDHTVRKFTRDGKLILTVGTAGVAAETGYVHDDYRTVTCAGGPFNRPTNVALTTTGEFYVTDGYGNSRVHCFAPDGSLRFSWGSPGKGEGQFHIPHGIAVDASGNVLVADRENNRIQVFTSTGRFIDQWAGLARPCDLAIGPDGAVYVAELGLYAGPYDFQDPPTDRTLHSRVSVLDGAGHLQARWGTEAPASWGSFYAAHCICLDSELNVYVGEVNYSAGDATTSAYHTVQKFVRQVSA